MPDHTSEDFEFFASCLPGLEGLLADELHALGVRRTRPLGGGVAFFGAPKVALRACLWSRLASRVLCVEGRVGAANSDALYQGVYALPWEEILLSGKSIAVRARGTNEGLRNTKFTGMRVKDAICDRLREVRGERPDVNVAHPDIAIDVRIHEGKATVSVDLSGTPLNDRAYFGRKAPDTMPLLCSYAAALLAYAKWGARAGEGFRFVDALAESRSEDEKSRGLSVLEREARAIVLDEAPGAARSRWGFSSWGRFDEEMWNTLLDEADERAERAQESLRPLDASAPQLVAAVLIDPANDNAVSAAGDAAFVRAAADAPARSVFACIGGEGAAERFGVEPSLCEELGRGRVSIKVRLFDTPPAAPVTIVVPDMFGGAEHVVDVHDETSSQFASRLRKVYKERRKWARREGVSCYRVYDADLPGYAAAIDLYAGAGEDEGKTFIHVAEYAAPSSIDELKARHRMSDILAITPVVLGVPPEHVFSKTRRRDRGGSQYRDAGDRSFVATVEEDGSLFEVDLAGYVDTGIFLDHRDTRHMVGEMAAGGDFLNLFAYTGTATVHAAACGARTTCTVDMSATYLDWARRNMANNGFSGRAHRFERADVMQWITEARRDRRLFDLVFVDPPTFSNSKSMGRRTWDVQRDHVELLIGVSRLLREGGRAVFSCNLRTFKPDFESLEKYGVEIEDITAQTIPHDFERNPRIHKCFIVRRK